VNMDFDTVTYSAAKGGEKKKRRKKKREGGEGGKGGDAHAQGPAAQTWFPEAVLSFDFNPYRGRWEGKEEKKGEGPFQGPIEARRIARKRMAAHFDGKRKRERKKEERIHATETAILDREKESLRKGRCRPQ